MALGLRWLARALSIPGIGLLLVFVFGDPPDPAKATLITWVLLLFFPFGVVIGAIVGWWREGLGGAIAVASLVAFYGMHALLENGRFPEGWVFMAFTVPGMVFLLNWLLLHSQVRAAV